MRLRFLFGSLGVLLAAAPVRAEAPAVVRPGPGGAWTLRVAGRTCACAVGRAGVARRGEKREGDGRTPAGEYPLRCLYFRPDKVARGELPEVWRPAALTPGAGWCDAPGDPRYNRFVPLPYPASHEELWRPDDAYDLIVPIGYNDAPVVPGLGSAIFFHVAAPGYAPTAGCVAVAKADLLALLRILKPGDLIRIEAD